MADKGSDKLIMHIDMDAFFAAVEQAHLPALKGKPVIVGGTPEGRGVVTTCSYEARPFGIHSAMSAAKAVKLCPNGVFINLSPYKYTHLSCEILRLLSGFTPLVEPVSIDEAFLDITDVAERYGGAKNLAEKIKKSIRDKFGLTASIGVAHVKFIAKMASATNKPDGLTIIEKGREIEYLWPQPVRNLWGIGPKTEESLKKLGIVTIEDLAKYPKPKLKRMFGIAAECLIDMANGKGEANITPGYLATTEKSMGHEHTFYRDESDLTKIRGRLLYLSDRVSRRLRADFCRGRTVNLKIKLPNFIRHTRSRTLNISTDCANVIYSTACSLFEESGFSGSPIRLIGVSVSNIETVRESDQPDLWVHNQEAFRRCDQINRLREIESVMDEIRGKYGDDSINRAGVQLRD